MMTQLKTQKNDGDVVAYLNTVENEQKRADSFALLEMMGEVTGAEASMWGDSIVGFGEYAYQYSSGRGGSWFLVGFAPRKQNLTLYIMSGFEQYEDLMGRLGKHKLGKSCLYIKRLADVDEEVLRELIKVSAEHMVATNSVS
ncbi:MAG TPA: DUF1801 domain-containing protein [Anaerolineae bacterium]|nr:DUF1801 domain-containing protein [Anaerolineae bacterium]